MKPLTRDEKEALRHAALAVLAARFPNALTAMAVRNRAAMEIDFTLSLEETEGALDFLKGLGLVEAVVDTLGSTGYFKCTSAGVLDHERSRRQ